MTRTHVGLPVGMTRLLLLAFYLPAAGFAQQEGAILRPTDGSSFPAGELSMVAKGPDAKLELDGQIVDAEQPFPNVYHAKVSPPQGEHVLALIWRGGRSEVRFFVGEDAPEKFQSFRLHPPVAVECTQCHGVSRRGRFRFKGGCFDCHEQDSFARVHQHQPHVLEQCGMCHNAHGSTVRAHLTMSREQACKQCHN